MTMQDIGIGVMGLGTVGGGVVETLARHGDLIAARTGVRPVLRAVAEPLAAKVHALNLDPRLSVPAEQLVDDPRVQIVVELIGGTTVARDLILRALRLGKPVVTANKALLAKHGPELFRVAREHHAGIAFEASVGGGIPVIRALRQGLIANRIARIYGILNGTCNYILTRMEEENAPFETVLHEAQAAGYAETDPSLDVDGHDTAHKATILATLAAGRPVALSAVPVKGIRAISNLDLAHARELGYRIKLLAIIRLAGEAVEVAVEPCLVPADHLLGQVRDVFNAVWVAGDVVGETLYYGRGAGRYPTASAILSDVADVARRLAAGPLGHEDAFEGPPLAPAQAGVARSRFYVRLTLPDRPDALARAADGFGRHAIGLASVVQHKPDAGGAVVLVVTHPSPAADVAAAIADLDAGGATVRPTVHFRLEDFTESAGEGA